MGSQTALHKRQLEVLALILLAGGDLVNLGQEGGKQSPDEYGAEHSLLELRPALARLDAELY